jgi:transcriptional regulator with XRE-family HTH domain
VIRVLCAHSVTQDQIAALTGKTQGRISEYMTGKRIPSFSTLEDFADGLGMPVVARRALGLAPEAVGSGPSDQAEGRSANIAGVSSGDVQPLLTNFSRASAVPVLSALREIHRGHVEADRLMGSICIAGPISLQMPVVERACEVTRGDPEQRCVFAVVARLARLALFSLLHVTRSYRDAWPDFVLSNQTHEGGCVPARTLPPVAARGVT